MNDVTGIERKTIEQHAFDCGITRKILDPGPWMSEPDRMEFNHSGFDCLLSRNPHIFTWCGYVAVPDGHPCFGKDYNNMDIDIHGGLTYAGLCGGQKGAVWWFGFDCAHWGDIMPSMVSMSCVARKDLEKRKSEYRDINYAMAQTKALARQLANFR